MTDAWCPSSSRVLKSLMLWSELVFSSSFARVVANCSRFLRSHLAKWSRSVDVLNCLFFFLDTARVAVGRHPFENADAHPDRYTRVMSHR